MTVHERKNTESGGESLPLKGNDAGKGYDPEAGYQSADHHLSMSEDEDEETSRLAKVLQGRFLLLLVAFLYGSLNVTLRLVYDRPGPPSASALSSSRGWMAAACFVPLLMNHKPTTIYHDATTTQSSFWRVAFELAFWNFGAQGLLALGLLSTESARASFFTQTSVVMTPILSAIAGYQLRCRVWLGCIIALIGLVLLSDSGAEKFSVAFEIGDLFCLSGAFCWSFYLFRLSSVGSSFDEVRMQAAKTLIMAFLYSGWFIVAQIQSETSLWEGWHDWISWALIFYSALGPGALADIIQQKGQAVVWAAEANVILSMEPVFTAILGLFLLGEATSVQEKFGGGLIILASIMSTSTD
eukprot:CAMPEP_0176007916 /NCGR_PEP_ID=MMETSP0120_2-20121206/3479_1 /TAXON_ID=160619 /ORGANISM="Kryptoperidinium foliaceum, Strain CCMP 1326" /LENGTH=354 /DNA_ID=CAMNT_0017340691 /DNA_START=85 /DNA_END=1149 /DNA_ORIENTATION=-